jgi:predicted dehydrogenase/threonine dehydrogenase-like Zn-dependent dehydrogenase
MRQLSQNLRTGKLSVDDVPAPGVQAGQVLVQAAYSLISAGTERTKIDTGRKSLLGKAMARPDQVRQVLASAQQLGLKATYEKVKTRLDSRSSLGYSAAGIVLGLGAGTQEFHLGDRVACGGATAAHAEVISVPKNLCVHVPDQVSLEQAAYTTVGAIALQGVRQADLRLGEWAVVVGLGLLGQLTVQLLKAAGCYVIGFDLSESRCSLAVQMGADSALSSAGALKAQVGLLTSSKGVDAVLITAGTPSNQPVELAGEICREKGRVVVVGAVGLTIPREPYYHKELDLRLSRSYGPGRYDPAYEEKGLDYPYGYVRWTEQRNMQSFLALVAEGRIDLTSLTTHHFRLEEAGKAYALIRGAHSEPYLGVLFEYPQTALPEHQKITIIPRSEQIVGTLAVGVIGAGNFAQSMLLPNLKKNGNVTLQGVTTVDPLQSRDVAERFGFTYAASTYEDLLSDPVVTAILIATRHDSHAKLVIEALQAGKAVHVEKPLAMTPTELEQVVKAYLAAQDRGNAFLLVGFNRRFAPMAKEIQHFFADRKEALSILYRINAGFIPMDHWTQDADQGGGRIIGEACHFIDLLQFFSGARVKQVYAAGLPDHGKYRADNLTISVKLADGSIGTVLYLANGDKALPKEYIEVSCEGKVAVLEDFRSLKLIAGGRAKVSHAGAQDKGHRGEMNAWVNAMQTGASEPVPFDHAVAATQATFAVLKSLSEGRPVSLE